MRPTDRAAGLAERAIVAEHHPMFVDGEWIEAAHGGAFPVFDPATGEVIGEVADGGPAEAARAIEAAHRAFPTWASMPARERAPILHRVQSLMEAHREDLALQVTRDGKPLEEARREIGFALGYFGWFAEEARRAYGDLVPSPAREKRLWVLHQPLGVVAAITPWNFPATMVTRKIAPALAAGCTVVLKPASATPLTALMLARLAESAGLPKGVLNVVTGARSAPIGNTLVEHPLVAKLAFTGSTDVGKALTPAAARTLKRVSLELGGNAPFVVFDDAALDAAVEGAVAMKFLRVGGQSCICANRILVQASDAGGYTHEVPFGGFKESGLGREGGRQGLEEYLETKSVVVGLPPPR
jgi:succinate-semialdehyde dehydrogenase / glutarate-semialdehyde dehydrogenase